ncbi:hypothetical protein DRQ09_01645 [candidate division KSB1 bacterium]|nr:MAG: hypothetical protein DRQ09_01645 [candidate division KSB1 bacterium]
MKEKLSIFLVISVFFIFFSFNKSNTTLVDSRITITENQKSFDVIYYCLNLEVFPASESISGYVEIKAKSLVNELSYIEIDLSNVYIIDYISSNNKSLNYTHSNNLIKITLSKIYSKNEEVNIKIGYHGSPPQARKDPSGVFYFTTYDGTNPIICTTCELEGARNWWPCKDYPGDKPDSMDINITVPENLTVATNGRLVEVSSKENKKTFRWHVSYPVTTYNVALNISNYAVFSDYLLLNNQDTLKMDFYVYPSNINIAKTHFQQVKDIISFYSKVFCPYPFSGDKLGMAEVCYWGMEHQTIIAYGNNYKNNTYSVDIDYIILHEFAHEWFGNMISLKDWGHFWLNEGFATYAEPLYIEEKYGKEKYHNYMKYLKNRINKSLENSKPIFCSDSTNARASYNINIYFKGAWILHSLRHIQGDSTFFSILKEYCSDPRFKYKNANTRDFIDVCEKVSGKELNWFFNQWIFGTGRPQYEYSWNAMKNNSGYSINLEIKQKGNIFKMPIDLTFKSAEKETTLTIWDSLQTQNFEIKLDFKPTEVLFDRENWFLRDVKKIPAKIHNKRESKKSILFKNYPNPFNLKTTIKYNIPYPQSVNLCIYDIKGKLIKTLVKNKKMYPGIYTTLWSGKNENNIEVSSGVYILVMKSEKFKIGRKLVLLK